MSRWSSPNWVALRAAASTTRRWRGPGRLTGSRSRPSPQDHLTRIPALLQRFPVTIVDGLLGSADPEALKRAREQGARIVLLVHMASPAEGGLSSAEHAHRASLERRALDAAWRVATPSQWAAADLRERYGPRRIVVARPGAYLAPIAAAHDPPRLLQLGTVGPLKNQQLAVAAASRCADLGFALRIVGPVADEAYAARLARAAYGRPVEILPAAEGAARERLYAETDLLFSLAHHESWGLTVTDALAHGIPAVVGRGTGTEEAPCRGWDTLTRDGGVDRRSPRPRCRIATLADRPRTARDWRRRAIAARDRLSRWEQTAGILAGVCADGEEREPITTR